MLPSAVRPVPEERAGGPPAAVGQVVLVGVVTGGVTTGGATVGGAATGGGTTTVGGGSAVVGGGCSVTAGVASAGCGSGSDLGAREPVGSMGRRRHALITRARTARNTDW